MSHNTVSNTLLCSLNEAKRVFDIKKRLNKTLWICFAIIVVYPPGITYANQKDTVEKTGDALLLVFPSLTYGTTFLLDDPEGRTQFYRSFFTNIGVTLALKYSINKPRAKDNGNYAFPSGHTSTVFQSATFLQRRYGWKYGVPAYLTAGLVGWSRVEADQHDWVDVTVGAALGILCSYYFTERFEGLQIAPIIENETYGLKVTMSW